VRLFLEAFEGLALLQFGLEGRGHLARIRVITPIVNPGARTKKRPGV
jgi:hypothetical protein